MFSLAPSNWQSYSYY